MWANSIAADFLSAGIIVTRVPGEKRQNPATELSSQIARQPQSLILTAVVLMLLALIPGFPFITLAFFSALLALPIILIRRKSLWFPQMASKRRKR
ncbi:FHIPEP family type III secretion protein [Salmonella sp. WGH-01]|nr:FHIPEP family type III secretion protein [Salmonella sp. WGH-01]